MFPNPPQLFRGKGVTDDPASETYWKAANGIRLSGMPSFKTKLSDTQLWQVSQLLAHANEIPESVKKVLVPDSPTTPRPPARPASSP
jgi:mono/diheme cytochrome c family protein